MGCIGVLASPGGGGRAVLGGIGLSGFPDFREWRLWRALGNCTGGSGIGWYWPFLGGVGGVLGGIGLFWGVLGGIGLLGGELGGIRRYWVVLAFPVGGKERGEEEGGGGDRVLRFRVLGQGKGESFKV